MSDVTLTGSKMAPRLSLGRQVALVGVAFSVGLFLGLCLHLPTFINHQGQGHVSLRHSRDVSYNSVDVERRKNMTSNRDVDRKRENMTSHTGSDWLKAKVKAIQRTVKDIKVMKAQQGRSSHDEEGHDVYGSKTVTVLISGQQPDVKNENEESDTPPKHAIKLTHVKRRHDDVILRQHDIETLDDLVTDGVYWSQQVEALLPAGFTDHQVASWRETLRNNRVVGMRSGCGRMQNRRLLLSDGSEACARYRINTDQLQGEVYTYYLSRLLHIHNLPPTPLSQVTTGRDATRGDARRGDATRGDATGRDATGRDATQSQLTWSDVTHDVRDAEWSDEKPVVLTPWLPHLRPVMVPRELKQAGARDDTGSLDVRRNLHPSRWLLSNRTLSGLVELAQWSDLIILDYLNANVDRLVNNMFNLQWNSEMMDSPTHNLEASSSDNLLVFIDNESGLFHSYRLLDKYAHYHDTLLASLCVFRASTARELRRLHHAGSVGRELMDLYRQEEPLSWMLPDIPDSNVKILEGRIKKVVDQIHRCESRYRTRDVTV